MTATASSIFTKILDEIAVRYSTLYAPLEVRSLDELDWEELGRYELVVVALARSVPQSCWRRFTELRAKCVLLVADCETHVDGEPATGVRFSSKVVSGGEVTLPLLEHTVGKPAAGNRTPWSLSVLGLCKRQSRRSSNRSARISVAIYSAVKAASPCVVV